MKKIIIATIYLIALQYGIYGQDTSIVYHSKRNIILNGTSNFRDLGGYPTKNGKFVKWGKIYRSADISELSNDDLKIILQRNIDVICDLRGPQEVTSKPDKYPVTTKYINLPAGSENVGNSSTYAKMNKDSLMLSFYTKTDHLKKKYKPMFDELLTLTSNKALLFHCTAGKDRTGIGAALILAALGVNKEYIIADYEATNKYWNNTNLIEILTKNGNNKASIKAMMEANINYINMFFETIDKNYGTMEKFLTKEIKLTKAKRRKLEYVK